VHQVAASHGNFDEVSDISDVGRSRDAKTSTSMKVEPITEETVRRPPRRSGFNIARPSRTLAVVALVLAPFATAGLASPAGAAKAPAPIALSELSSRSTLTVIAGRHLTVTLHSTYWTLAALKSSAVVQQLGKTVVTGSLPSASKGCVAGQGCATLVAHFVDTHPGVVRLRATRTSCGEAMRCTPAQSVWTVLVRVR
jgi:hypothetical protein